MCNDDLLNEPTGSLQYVGRQAGDILGLLAEASRHEHAFFLTCHLLPQAMTMASRACMAAGVDLMQLLAAQPTLRNRPEALVRLPRTCRDAFQNVVDAIENPSTRATASTAARKASRLVRVILTAKASGHLTDIIGFPEERPAKPPRPLSPTVVTSDTTEPATVEEVVQTVVVPKAEPPAYGTVELVPDWRERLQERSAPRRARFITPFIEMLAQAPKWEPLGPAGFTIPGWHWAPSLDLLRDLYDAVLGPVRRDPMSRSVIARAQPSFRDLSEQIYRTWPNLLDASTIGNGPTVLPEVNFPNPLWTMKTVEVGDTLPDWSPAVTAVRGRARLLRPDQVTPAYSHGLVRDIQVAVACGRHVLIQGAAGTSKSTTVASLDLSGRTVFEIGDSRDNTIVGQNTYPLDRFEQLLTKAVRTKGAKVLVVHEFVLTPQHLARLGIFHQIIMVGDPRQPGPLATVDHIFAFMHEIGAKFFTLPVVWRCRNPLPFRFNSYVAYGSALKAFKPWFLRYAAKDPDAADNSVNVLSCPATATMVAATMLAHAMAKIRHGRTVLIATDDEDVVVALQVLLTHMPELPRGSLQCRHLSDIQGRSADVAIIDLLECAAQVPDVDDALRWWVMVCGRPRFSLSLVVRQDSRLNGPWRPLPLLACAATFLYWRITHQSVDVPESQDLALAVAAVHDYLSVEHLDEQTMAVTTPLVTIFAIVKDVHQSNVPFLITDVCVVALPELFDPCVDHSEIITRIVAFLSGYNGLLKPGLTTMEALEDEEMRPDPADLRA